MRIARIIEYFPPHIGGMERHSLILSQEQIKLGYSVDVFIGYGGEAKSNFSAKGGSASGGEDASKSDFRIYKAPFQFLPLYSKARRFWFNFWAMRQVAKRHKKNPYNVIHLHGDFIEAFFGGKLSKKLGIPALITIHAGLNKRFLKPKNAEYFKNIAKIICVSNEIAGDLKSIGVSENKIKVISSGIYLNEFSAKGGSASGGKKENDEIDAIKNQYSKPIVISVGVLRVNKGFKYLIESFKMVKEKFDTVTLIVIGDGPDRSKLEAWAKNIGDVYFLGRQNHDKVIEYLKSADIFVLASVSTASDREGTPTSIMEAMAAGLPIIATNVGGVADLVQNEKNGFVVNPGNSEELSTAMVELINNPDLGQKMAAQNLEDIKLKDWPIIVRQIDDVYKSILW